MLKTRLLTAAVAVPVLLGIIFSGCPIVFLLLIVAVNLGGSWEFFRMALPGERASGWLAGLGAGTLLVVGSRQGGPSAAGGLLWVCLLLLFAHALFSPGDIPSRVKRLFVLASGLVYVSFSLSFFTPIWATPSGPRAIVLFLAVSMLSDTGQFLAGRRFGRRKLYPTVSPNKTWEGAFGGLAAGVVAGVGADVVLGLRIPWPDCAMLAGGIVVLGIVGDLFESLLKRASGTKDSGGLFPGHGGMLDRLDSLLFPAPFVWYFLYGGSGG